MKSSHFARFSPLFALLLLTACDQHTPVLKQVERVEAENATVRQQIQAVEQQLMSLGANQAFAAAHYQQQTTTAITTQKNLQKDVSRLNSDLLVMEPKLKALKSRVKLFMDRQGR
jgi:predicted component of type VI protein secretion system